MGGREEWLLSFKTPLYMSQKNSQIQICVSLYALFWYMFYLAVISSCIISFVLSVILYIHFVYHRVYVFPIAFSR